jgi:hypothetical protein
VSRGWAAKDKGQVDRIALGSVSEWQRCKEPRDSRASVPNGSLAHKDIADTAPGTSSVARAGNSRMRDQVMFPGMSWTRESDKLVADVAPKWYVLKGTFATCLNRRAGARQGTWL